MEQLDGGGFQLLWERNDGQAYSFWNLNASGQFQNSDFLSFEQLVALEPTFAQDFDGNGAIA